MELLPPGTYFDLRFELLIPKGWDGGRMFDKELTAAESRKHLLEAVAIALAGLQQGVFSSLDDIAGQWQREALFEPDMNAEQRARLLAGWDRSIARVKSD